MEWTPTRVRTGDGFLLSRRRLFFFFPSFPRSCRNPNPLSPSGPVRPQGPLCPGLQGSCRGGTGGVEETRSQNWSPDTDRYPPLSISTTPALHSTSTPANRRPSISNSTRLLGGKSVLAPKDCPPPVSPPEEKRAEQCHQHNASTLGCCSARAWRHPPQLKLPLSSSQFLPLALSLPPSPLRPVDRCSTSP
jgi:hypothetical protein